ncbi:MAG: glycoside hydrolase family 3 C-terminal domain-containing protein [Planctomycetes bacterium]|nr:glycoside hydrolase family 3 C-terminal domain-containing protein [Planctomycetota bacterium]MCH8968908.1 glycoside hydrolase family 3 C-terminal domain-containing protein [Planctomycetota bacterium]
MTLGEKLSQLVSNSPAIERLDIPKYNWWTEGLHGVKGPLAGASTTAFPQAIGMAATWDTDLIQRVADAIAEEARALHHFYARAGRRSKSTGLTLWAPNINIFRDPRWGRGQETYGEDPYLTSRLGVAYVRGLQGKDPRYLKTIATPKHFAVHSGPEVGRHGFNATANERDLRETYLPAFRACVIEGQAYSVMCAYNALNGSPCCGSERLLTKILRSEWGFEGCVVADCGAVDEMREDHGAVETEAAAAALATLSGCDLACYWGPHSAWRRAVEQGLLTETDIDRALERVLKVRFRLGLFDPLEIVPYAQIPEDVLDCRAHRNLALRTARESIVLLKNDAGTLPLSKTLRSIAVIGPNADDPGNALLGSYHSQPEHRVTPLEGIRSAVGSATEVSYAVGCPRVQVDQSESSTLMLEQNIAEAARLASRADIVILCLGLSTRDEGFEGTPGLEGEEMGTDVPGFSGGDRTDLRLPASQDRLLRALHSTGKPIVLVLLNGSALAVNWADRHCPAILEAWYPGQEGGTAIAEVLFGDYNPAGRLPITFYRSVDDLPPYPEYSMSGRTYRYFEGEVLYAFGHGLSYTQFQYSSLSIQPNRIQSGERIVVAVTVQNVGTRAGDEVVQLYLTDLEASAPVPIRSLQGFRRVHLEPGEQKHIVFELAPRQMSLINSDMQRVIEPGAFEVSVGGKQPGVRGSIDAASTEMAVGRFELWGEVLEVD